MSPSAGRDSFVHLHVHSEYSMLDGAARIADLMDGCQQMAMPAIGLTDHGYLFGAHEFHTAATRVGVKPIIGLEAYVTPKTHRSERKRVRWGDGGSDDVSGGGAYTHMTLWAETTEGMHNLFRLGTRSSTEGYFYKPRADRELLNEYARGMIASTGCPSGEVQTYLRLGKYDDALASAAEFRDIFGAGNYYVELMDHGLAIERRVREDLLRIARDLKLPLVATNDLHYAHAEDADAHEVLLCVQSGSTMADANRFKLDGGGYYLKSPAEMRELFRELPEACDSTLEIAERCNVEFTHGEGRYMPRYPVPQGHDETSWFLHEVEEGLKFRYPEGIAPEVRQRAEFESEVIIGKGFPGYYLVVADFMQWAKDRGIRTGVRGSGAGSLCAYAMRITDLDPLQYKLTFERFLNPERESLPDFDVDFDERRRGEVIRYVTEKYGSERVAQIVTYGTIKAKQAVKDASRVLGYPFAVGEKLTKAMPPPVMGKDIALPKLFDRNHDRYSEGGEFRALYESDPDAKKVVDTAMGIEGLKRQWGVHAAGVIMSSEPLIDIVPLMRREQDGAIITQFDYAYALEPLGLVKMDFLGLRNLTILGDAVENVKLNRGVDIDLDALGKDPTDDATYELLSSGETLGVFQLDGGGARSLLKMMQPKRIQDIMATIALYRPGPMGINSHVNYAMRRRGDQPVVYPHEEVIDALKPVIEDNYGLIVYQEDVIEVARRLAGYTLGRADMLRRAMGKKKKAVLDAEYETFQKGMKERGFSDAAVKAVWDALMPFADYGFGKAHAAAYGLVSYWTAYLKTHYPAEYMAAVLESVKDDKDKIAIYLGECRRMKIKVLPPDVNESQARFTPVGSDIRFGLTAIRNVGGNVVDGIVAAREHHGKARDFHAFLDQIPLVACNKRVIESLIKAGAFDSMGHTRRALMSIYEAAVDGVIDLKRNEAHGQSDLFGDLGVESSPVSGTVPDLEDWDKRTKLAFEREMLGLYVSDHPLQGLEHVLERERDLSISSLVGEDGPRDSMVTIAGMITSITRKTTKRGDIWAVITVEDLEASIEVLLFPKAYDLVSTVIAEDTVVRVKGRVRDDEDSIALIGQELSLPDVSAGPSGPVVISLPVTRCTPATIDKLAQILKSHPGMTEVQLKLKAPNKITTMRVGSQFRVTSSQPLMADLKAELGPSCLAG
ncbi:DNA polymerase III subunit alpha [Microlunatus sp. Gsoil 973]|uniref:DNA polymerase III subunit alpha n=1 Tax=Microlunatus sp. Gsoil 973 TaxID=2672569 RepID=UPI0012B4985A|nr:DNA polymerase III subunit alpha [Microlunatus sp. Gsoil 973]QGN32390.1 DNA polymerase III subunit alpha [Microlunatus sp. Gsoil 973]